MGYIKGGRILQEDGFVLLLESGGALLLEGTIGAEVPDIETGLDIKLTYDPNNFIYDINFRSDGDFELLNNFDTAIQMSLLTDKRAEASEVPQPELRGGWWGNLLNDVQDYQIGSKLWLLYQARKTTDNLNNAIDFVKECFDWMVEDNYISRVDVDGAITEEGFRLEIDFIREDNKVEKPSYKLWETA